MAPLFCFCFFASFFCSLLGLARKGGRRGERKEEARKEEEKVVEVKVEEKIEEKRRKTTRFFRIGEATGFGPPLIRQHANDSMKYKTRTIGF